MLRQLRSAEKMKKVFMIALLILVIPAFVLFYGWGEYSQSKKNSASDVAVIDYPDTGKHTIAQTSLQQAENEVRNQYEAYMQLNNIPVDQNTADPLVTLPQTVDEAINLDILRHYAEVHGISATTDEAMQNIQSQTTPEQRMMLQQQWARQGKTVAQILDEMRASMVINKARATIAAQTRVTNYEAWLNYEEQHQQLVADYVRFTVNDFKSSVTVNEADLKSYFNSHIENFRIPDQVKYQFILVRKEDLKSSITVSNDEITSYYENNKESFRLPRKAQVREIFLKKPNFSKTNTTSPAEMASMTETIRSRAEELYQRAAKGENFAQLATKSSEESEFPPREDANTTATDANTTAGGYLGQISQDVAKTWYGDAWTSTVFSMDPGSISHPIETPTGFAIVKLEKITIGTIRPLDQVKQTIVDKIKDEKVEPIFDKVGQSLEEAATKFTGLQQVAKATSTTMQETGKMDKSATFIPKIGLLGDFAEAVHDLEKGGISDLLSDKQRHLLMEVVEEFPAHDPSLEEVRAKATAAYKESKGIEAAKKAEEKLSKAGSSKAAFEKAVVDAKTTVTKSRPFTRPDAQSVFGMLQNFDTISRGWKKGEPLVFPIGQSSHIQAYVVARLDNIIEPSKTEFSKNFAEIVQGIQGQKQHIIVKEFLRDQRQKLKDRITIGESYRQ
jgi:peptidyl-prolyl cis-trans isomerase D